MPAEQIEFEARRSGLSTDYFKTCADCSMASTVKTISATFDRVSGATGE